MRPQWRQLQVLTEETKKMVQSAGQLVTPMTLFLALLALSMGTAQGTVYWAYVPNPPLLQAVTWRHVPVPVYTNATHVLGGHHNGHIKPANASVNFSGLADDWPICFTRRNDSAGCVVLDYYTIHSNNMTADNLTQWEVWVTGLGKWAAGGNETRWQPDLRLCEPDPVNHTRQPFWMACRGETGTRYNFSGQSLVDWGARTPLPGVRKYSVPLSERYWTTGGPVQGELWRLVAGLGTTVQWSKRTLENSYSINPVKVQACVPSPYALLLGEVKIQKANNTWRINCTGCMLRNCIMFLDNRTQMLVVHQPSFVFLPVNVSKWYSSPGWQVIELATQALARPRRAIGLIIAGIAALITLIAASTAAAVDLTQSIQTANYVNALSANVSGALGLQEDIDRSVEVRLNALYDVVRILGNEVSSLRLRVSLDCHAEYKTICVTRKEYNESQVSWSIVKQHLEGVWRNNNDTLNILQLHQDIIKMRESHLETSLAEEAEKFVKALQGQLPSPQHWQGLFTSVLVMGGLVVIGLVVFPWIMKLIMYNLRTLETQVHKIKLHSQGPDVTWRI